jgi:hypothetical protein
MSQIGTGSYSPSDWTWTVNMDAATVKQGADNSVGVSQQTGPRVGTIELPLMQTSLSNNWLWSLCQLQRARIPGTCITAPVAAAIPEGDRSLRILNGIVMSLKARGSIQKLGNFTVNIAV